MVSNITDSTVDRVLALNLTLIRIPQRQQILFAIFKILRNLMFKKSQGIK